MAKGKAYCAPGKAKDGKDMKKVMAKKKAKK